MRFPVVKIYECCVKRRDVVYTMKVNNCRPTSIGHLRAQIIAATSGARRLKKLLARYGKPTVCAAVEDMVEYGERQFRGEGAKWLHGESTADFSVHHDPRGNPNIHCEVTVRGATSTCTSLVLAGVTTCGCTQPWTVPPGMCSRN